MIQCLIIFYGLIFTILSLMLTVPSVVMPLAEHLKDNSGIEEDFKDVGFSVKILIIIVCLFWPAWAIRILFSLPLKLLGISRKKNGK